MASTNIINAMGNKRQLFFTVAYGWSSDQNLGNQTYSKLSTSRQKDVLCKHAIFPSLKVINRMVRDTKLKSSILGHSS